MADFPEPERLAGAAWRVTVVLALSSASVLALGSARCAQAYCAYVTHDDVVSVIDTVSNTVAATIAVGASPVGVAVTPDGRSVYVANCGASCLLEGAPSEDRVSVIDTATNALSTIPVGGGAWGGIAIASVPGGCAGAGLPCVGDCGGDVEVTVDEIITMVNVALGFSSVNACSAGDANGDGQITIDEILAAVNHTLNGCVGYSNTTLQGAWLFEAITLPGYYYILFDGQGGIADIGAFCFQSGTYHVRPDGSFSVTVASPHDEFCDGSELTVDGSLTSPSAGTLTLPAGLAQMRKIADPSTCQGQWEGVLSEDNSLQTYAVTFSVGSDGTITSLTGLPLPVTGKMYGDAGSVAGFLRASTTAPYFDVKLLGTLSNNTVTGQYVAEVPGQSDLVHGGFVLNRHT